MRRADIYMYDALAGTLWEDEEGYHFQYADTYIADESAEAISLTLPLQTESFHRRLMFSFFDGLIAEGWLLEIAEKNWRLNPRDRMGILLKTCVDCVGAVSVVPVKK